MNAGRRARRQRALRARRRRYLIIAACVAGVAALAIAGVLLTRRPAAEDLPTTPVEMPEATVEATVGATAVPVETPEPTEAPTSTPEPTPEATVASGEYPDVVSFYQPESKAYSPRVKMGETFEAKWKKGEDIGSFEVIASDADRLEGDFFGDIFGAAWKAFPDADRCKIGYTLRYTLKDGSEIKYSMLSPAHVEHTEYIECWLYDDYHREPHKTYSHIKSMKKDTLMTSIKLTCGKKIDDVEDIWLTAFICSSLAEFDGDRNYIGETSCTLHIARK